MGVQVAGSGRSAARNAATPRASPGRGSVEHDR